MKIDDYLSNPNLPIFFPAKFSGYTLMLIMLGYIIIQLLLLYVAFIELGVI